MKRIVRLLLLVLGVLVFCYAAGGVYLLAWGDRAVFLPQPATYQECRFLPLRGGERIAFRAITRPDARLTLIYSHGSSGDLGMLEAKVEAFRQFGLNVVIYDYPGTGLSSGPLSETGCYEAIEAIYDWVRSEMGVPDGRIVLYGRSIGTGPTLYLAGRRACGGVIVVSPFTSALGVHWTTAMYGIEKFPNYRFMPLVKAPILVLAGDRDENVPWREVERLMKSAPAGTELVRLVGFGHKDLDQSEEFWRSLSGFLQLRVLKAGAGG